MAERERTSGGEETEGVVQKRKEQSGGKEGDWAEDDLMKFSWFHPTLTRHQAESLLLENGTEGCYLLRKSEKPKQPFSVSFRCQDAVRHVGVERHEDCYQFGLMRFKTCAEFMEHMESGHPVLGLQSGTSISLVTPYPRTLPALNRYEKLDFARWSCGEASAAAAGLAPAFSTTTQEGVLWKRGKINTGWKERWFKLHRFSLAYYKSMPSDAGQARKPIDVIDLRKATRIAVQEGKGAAGRFEFVLETPARTYYLSANTEREREVWVECIQLKISESQRQGAALVWASSRASELGEPTHEGDSD